MNALVKVSHWLSKMGAYLSSAMLVYMVFHILLEIILRSFFAKSTYVLDEFVAYSTAGITFLSLAHSMNTNTLIRVGILLNRLSGLPRRMFEIFSLVTTIIIMTYFSYYFWLKTFWRDIKRGCVSESIAEVPLWIPELIVLIGLVIFLLQLIVTCVSVCFDKEPANPEPA